jgi:hypothetical protein
MDERAAERLYTGTLREPPPRWRWLLDKLRDPLLDDGELLDEIMAPPAPRTDPTGWLT